MQLTRHTDYSLRVLIFLSIQQDATLVTINEMVKHFNVSKNHLTKVVHNLASKGYVKTVQGKNGGMCLAIPLDSINLGTIIKKTEHNIEVINCHKPICPLEQNCKLKGVLNEAQEAFFNALSNYTLADITHNKNQIKALLNWEN
ncbi:MAG: Rrf2 family transcriptional regulator [Woeseiaceae bacterium]